MIPVDSVVVVFKKNCYSPSMILSTRKSKLLYTLISLLILGSRWPGHDSEDIKNLRLNFKSGNPTDFWGGISSLFYGHIPDFYPGWESLLLLLQWGFASVGLFLILKIVLENERYQIVILMLEILLIGLSTLITRDGLMLSMLLFSTGLLFESRNKPKEIKNLLYCLAFFLILFASSFRPWISPAIAATIAYICWQMPRVKRNKFKQLMVLLFVFLFIGLSISLEIESKQFLHLEKSFPEQQVFLMDLSANACWSTNRELVSKSIDTLDNFYQDKQVPSSFCNTFRPANWVHLFHRDPINNSQPKFKLLEENDESTYRLVRSAWLHAIIKYPVDYLQNKLMYGSQLIFGGDSRRIHLLGYLNGTEESRSKVFLYFSGLVLLPLDLAISIHLFSPFFSGLFLAYLWRKRAYRLGNEGFKMTIIGVLIFQTAWLLCTVIAYIGDTARFSYTCGALALLVIYLTCEKSRLSIEPTSQ